MMYATIFWYNRSEAALLGWRRQKWARRASTSRRVEDLSGFYESISPSHTLYLAFDQCRHKISILLWLQIIDGVFEESKRTLLRISVV